MRVALLLETVDEVCNIRRAFGHLRQVLLLEVLEEVVFVVALLELLVHLLEHFELFLQLLASAVVGEPDHLLEDCFDVLGQGRPPSAPAARAAG